MSELTTWTHGVVWRWYDVYATSHILCINVETTLSKGMQLNFVKSIFIRFWVMVQISYIVMTITTGHFRVFIHGACSKTRNPQEISISSFFKVLLLSDFKSFSKDFVCSAETIKLFLKIIKENLPLRSESGFSCY